MSKPACLERAASRPHGAGLRRFPRLLAACALIGACAQTPERPDDWVGVGKDDLFLSWGDPSVQERIDPRTSRLTYQWRGPMLEEGHGISLHCETVFLVRDGLVASAEWMGSAPGCRNLLRGRPRDAFR